MMAMEASRKIAQSPSMRVSAFKMPNQLLFFTSNTRTGDHIVQKCEYVNLFSEWPFQKKNKTNTTSAACIAG